MAYTPSVVTVPDQYFHGRHHQPTEEASHDGNGLPTPPESFHTSIPPTPSEHAIAGRKRSRGEMRDDEIGADAVPIQLPAAVPRGEPIYGPGMTLVYPNDPSGHYTADAGTQSGTWLDERQEQEAAAAAAALSAAQAARPIMPSRKSQRMSASVVTSNIVPESLSHSTPRSPAGETAIDEASHMLGISWSRMDQTESSQISQRAYTRWIDKHYPQLTAVEIWFENKAIEAYLGKAVNTATNLEEYYLWSNDLKQAVLVTRNSSELVMKLGQPQLLLTESADRLMARSQTTDTADTALATGMEID